MQPMFKIHVNVAEGQRNEVILRFNTFGQFILNLEGKFNYTVITTQTCPYLH